MYTLYSSSSGLTGELQPSIHPSQHHFLRDVGDGVAVAEYQKRVGGFMTKQSVQFVQLELHRHPVILRFVCSVVEREPFELWARRDER